MILATAIKVKRDGFVLVNWTVSQLRIEIN